MTVVGSTASLLPEAFFERGVGMIGGVAVTRPDELLDVTGRRRIGLSFLRQVRQPHGDQAAGPAGGAWPSPTCGRKGKYGYIVRPRCRMISVMAWERFFTPILR